MMQVTSRDRLPMQVDLGGTRNFGRTSAIIIPTLTECTVPGCGYDAKHDSGINPSCTVCDGLGQVAEYVVYTLYANIRVVDDALIAARMAPPGAVLGDTFTSADRRHRSMLDRLYNEKESYWYIDGSRFRPNSIQSAGVGQVEELIVMMISFAPRFVAKGY